MILANIKDECKRGTFPVKLGAGDVHKLYYEKKFDATGGE